MWPFQRRSNRRKPTGGAENPKSEMHDAGASRDLAKHNGTELASAGPERRRSRRDTKRKSSRESKKLQRDPERRRTYSFSPGRRDSIRVPRDVDRPPVPPLPAQVKGKGVGSNNEKTETTPARTKPERASTQPPDGTQDWQRMPTLHKRSAQELAHRKSSKKRKEEHDREAEIKAMVAFMPTRPAADPNSSGRPLRRESRKMREGLNRNLENPSSDISLPLADSIHSSLSSGSECRTSYKLTALDMLAPRPTIRYSENPRYPPGVSGFGSDRSDSRKRRVSERAAIPDETLKANKRIDDLADDLDARELRELMERDQKRREKKKVAERIKMEKRLARRQEKQKVDEAAAARDGTPSPTNMERGVLGREVVGLGIGTSAVVTSSKRKGSTGSETGRGKRPADSFREDFTASPQNPFGDSHRSPSPATENMTPASEHSDPVIETAKVGTVAKANISPSSSQQGHARGASSISQLMELSKAETSSQAQLEPISKPLETQAKAHSSWASFFKLRAKNKRGSPPPSFSNTSRDSMQNQGPQIGYTPMKSTSNVPKRTMSKFREDLPELPISPPDSRVQSPEADVVPPIRSDYPDKKTGNRASSDDPRIRYDTPTSGYRSIDAVNLRDETPTSGHQTMDAPSPEPAGLSQSLASIDSEGSWLSGRKGGSKRGSNPLPQHPLRDSASSLHRRYKEFGESAEELGIAEDEYFSRLTPGPYEQYKINRESTGNPMPSSDEEDGGSVASPVSSEKTKWGAVARHATVVHREPRAKSREGLLNEFDDESLSEVQGETPTDMSPKGFGLNQESIPEDELGVHRATSVDLGKGHVRRISAGSARLLDVKPRASGEAKRFSSG
jgi:hypothetical protein